MGLEGPRKLAKTARTAFYATMLGATIFGSPEHSQAGKNKAIQLAGGLKVEDTLKPGITAKDSPEDKSKGA